MCGLHKSVCFAAVGVQSAKAFGLHSPRIYAMMLMESEKGDDLMAKIAVIGFGQGGTLAALRLARQGHSVSLFERQGREGLGHPWYDDIRFDIFAFCGLPLPPRSCYTNKGKRLFISPDCKNSLRVPSAQPMEEISISRPALNAHLAALCEEAGVRLAFETPVERLLLERDRVTGVTVGGVKIRFDLVIDASGLFSPFRAQVPAAFGVEPQPASDGVMTAWRGFFKWAPGTKAPDPDRNIYIKHMGSVGLSWCNLNDRGEVDVFVGRIGGLGEDERKKAVAKLQSDNDFCSREVLREGVTACISLRAPNAGLVADGYVLLGDSAFMTMPMMGSGIEASMKAAVWLTDLIGQMQTADFSAANLWPYQVKYYTELGTKYAFIDIVKRWVLGIDTDLLNWLFGCGAVTNEDMGLVSTDPNNPNKLTAGKVLKKVAVVLQKPKLIAQTAIWMRRALHVKHVALALPKSYDLAKVQTWQKQYLAALRF